MGHITVGVVSLPGQQGHFTWVLSEAHWGYVLGTTQQAPFSLHLNSNMHALKPSDSRGKTAGALSTGITSTLTLPISLERVNDSSQLQEKN